MENHELCFFRVQYKTLMFDRAVLSYKKNLNDLLDSDTFTLP